MKIVMFPGQGSQSKGMGAGLFEHFEDLTDQADRILGYSIRQLCLEDPGNQLDQTQFTQPALYVVNALSYFKKIEETGVTPDFVVGHSLGEFNALLAAGCFGFETGLKLVKKRGELMAQATNGAMAAVLNATRDEIVDILKSNGLNNVYLANDNAPSQIVISGLADEIAKAEPLFRKAKVRFYPLATSGAFHSAFMQDAMEQFRVHLAGFEFAAPLIPVIANVTARPYADDAILETLASQITSTVRWTESVQYLLRLGASRGESVDFEQLGHGDVLTRLVLTIKAQTPQALLDQPIEDVVPPPQPTGIDEKVTAWNKRFSVGTKVKSSIADYADLETRTEAVVLFGHRAAVYMKGYNGYFDLDELTVG